MLLFEHKSSKFKLKGKFLLKKLLLQQMAGGTAPHSSRIRDVTNPKIYIKPAPEINRLS